MIKKTLLVASLSAALLTAFVSTEAEVKTGANAEIILQLKAKLKKQFKAEPQTLKQSVLPNLYEAMYGTEVVYVSGDGKYFISGDILNLETRENMTDIAKQSVRRDILDREDNKPVVFKAERETEVLTVFTDIDCPYCAKLHREVPKLNKMGITVEYLMFPRAGIGSPSFDKAINMWCADDSKQAMTDAKERKPIPEKTCDNPIEKQYNLSQELGITGTPALITQSGKLIPGYMPADRLAELLAKEKPKTIFD